MNQVSTRINHEQMSLFSQASHDVNPLHTSAEYARKTPYGQPVVFGVLGALASMRWLTPRSGQTPAKLDLEFSNAIFPDQDYRVEIEEEAASSKLLLADGRRPLVKGRIEYRPGGPERFAGDASPATLNAARERDEAELSAGQTIEGAWAPATAAFAKLQQEFELAGKGGDARYHAALLWSSYFVGMDLPGKQALFNRLVLEFDEGEFASGGHFDYRVQIKVYQPVFRLLVLGVELFLGGQRFAHGEIRAFLREQLGQELSAAATFAEGDALRGKVALVIGGSRGLGASLVEALVRQGCSVLLNYARSQEEASNLARRLEGGAGRVELIAGDASETSSCMQMYERIRQDYGRLDILICNACPALLPLWIEPESISRIQNYVVQSTAMVLAPLAALGPLVSDSGGACVFISSAAVQKPLADWPHYVAAKAAAEGIFSVAALEFPGARYLIARPSRLRTDLTNTPLGRKGAISPAQVAAALVEWLGRAAELPAGAVSYQEGF